MPFGIGQAISGLHNVVFARRHSKDEQRLSAGSGVCSNLLSHYMHLYGATIMVAGYWRRR